MGWNNPQLGNFIATDVPEIKRMLTALAKLDPSLVSSDIPAGAKRLVTISSGWQIQSYSNESWAPITSKLMHDVDKLDGYHAAITPNANTVAVRNANKKLEGDITGNAATASSAATLSETLPVNKGGTGATTSAAARTNLGVPPTSHASSNTTYGLGSNANYGHVRGDGVTTNVVAGEVVTKDVAIGGDSADLISGRGIFNSASKAAADYNDLRSQGAYTATNAATNGPGGARRVIVYAGQKDDPATTQLALPWMSSNKDQMRISLRSSHSTNGWAEWVDLITSRMFASKSSAGIIKLGSGLSAGSEGTVNVDDTVLRTSGTQSISGTKTFTGALVVSSNAPGFWLKQADVKKGTLPTATQYENIYFTTSESVEHPADTVGLITNTVDTNGKNFLELRAYKFEAGSTEAAVLGVYKELDGTSYGRAPTPADDSNTNHIATTAWVRNYVIPTGTLIPSFVTSMTGYLLCNGAAVSRTTYAKLFAVIGTKFGAGDGSKTFNLPDFRNRVFWGASGNLMSVIEAGLPDHSHSIDVRYDSRDCGYASGSPRFWQGYYSGSTGAASASNAIYGKSTTVQPPAIAVSIFIKY